MSGWFAAKRTKIGKGARLAILIGLAGFFRRTLGARHRAPVPVSTSTD